MLHAVRHTQWQIIIVLLVMVLVPSGAFARVCDFQKGKMNEVAALSSDEMRARCDKNIGAEADKIARDERETNVSACVNAYQVAKTEAEKYLKLRDQHCAEIYQKSVNGPSTCSNQPGDSAQAACLEKIAANLKEAAALEAKLETALKSAKVSADAAVNYTVKAVNTLMDKESAIINAVEAEMKKAVDAFDGQMAAKTVREATVITGGQLAVGGTGEVRASEAGPGVSTISGFKEKVPQMIDQQTEAATVAKQFSEEAASKAALHNENVKRFQQYAAEAAAKAKSLKTASAGISKSEDDNIPIPTPRPKPSQLRPTPEQTLTKKIENPSGPAGDANPQNSSLSSGPDPVPDNGPTAGAQPTPVNGNSALPAVAGAAGSAGMVGSAYANRPAAHTSGLGMGTEPVTDGLATALKSASTTLETKAKKLPVEKEGPPGEVPEKVDPVAAVPGAAEKAGGQVGITGIESNTSNIGGITSGSSRAGGGDARGVSGGGSGKLAGGKSKSSQSLDPAVKNFQPNLAEGGLPMKSSDLNSTFDSFASEFGVDPSVGLTAEEQEAFASLKHNPSGAGSLDGNDQLRGPSSQFDASVEGRDGQALFVRTKLALVRAVKKGLLIQNLKNKL